MYFVKEVFGIEIFFILDFNRFFHTILEQLYCSVSLLIKTVDLYVGVSLGGSKHQLFESSRSC